MITRLLVLWLLSEGPLHGYRVRRILTDDAMGFWFRVEDASIYSMLRGLARAGLAKETGEERVGKRPVRTLYAITREGRAELRRLLLRAWREVPRPGDALDAAIAARSELDDREIRGALLERSEALRVRRRELEARRRAAPADAMVDRERARLRAESVWTKRMLASLRPVCGRGGRGTEES